MRHFISKFCVMGLAVSAASCSGSKGGDRGPVVTGFVNHRTLVAQGQRQALVSEVTLSKAAILNRDFLYGSDIQYSTMGDGAYSLILQAMTLGHVPAQFKVRGQTLQLVADQRIRFESDINHPERLINEFKILREDADTLTVQIDQASPVLATVLGGGAAAKPRTSWIRSLEFVSDGNYLLMESSIESAEGDVVEFMESLFPRDTLVPADYKPLLADEVREPLAGRYRFLSWGPVYMDFEADGKSERVQSQAANRFRVAEGELIRWYVTPNVPDEYLSEIRAGLEGWNRYSQAMWGKDFIRFAGKLPSGVKIGDPRYNVISWDSVAEAGAAYESQASDPLTGLQSHSLIYLPNAWLNIGRDFWKQGGLSDAVQESAGRLSKLVSERKFFGKGLPIRCLQDLSRHVSLESQADPESFAKELLKGVLFHEVGHALGLDHNFKGSLSLDLDDPAAAFSTSIMDYNQFHLERGAFVAGSSEGPLLEYDRQIISVLYNEGKDVRASDPIVPACNDDETDSFTGGVDPFCIRYDAGQDPTEMLARTLRLASEEKFVLGKSRSLPASLKASVDSLGDPLELTEVSALKSRIEEVTEQVAGLATYYLLGGAQSVANLARSNLRSLYVFKDGVFTEARSAEATQMRLRAWHGLEWVTALDTLPLEVQTALDHVVADAEAWLEKTPAFLAVAPDQKTDQKRELLAGLAGLKIKMSANEDAALLVRLRRSVLSGLKRNAAAPFYFEVSQLGVLDFEAKAIAVLSKMIVSPLSGSPRAFTERLTAIDALKTFITVPEGLEALVEAKKVLLLEKADAKDARGRDRIRKLIQALGV